MAEIHDQSKDGSLMVIDARPIDDRSTRYTVIDYSGYEYEELITKEYRKAYQSQVAKAKRLCRKGHSKDATVRSGGMSQSYGVPLYYVDVLV